MPELYGNSLLAAGELEFLCAALRPGMRVLEVGTWHGKTAAQMADRCPGAMIVCVDQLVPSPALDVRMWFRNREHRPNMMLFVGRMNHFESLRPAPFDMIFHDADHELPGARDVLVSCLNLLKPGGRLFVHDHCDAYPGVVQACSEMCGDWKIIRAGEGCSLVELVKP